MKFFSILIVIVALLLGCLCIISCSPAKGTVNTSKTTENPAPFKPNASNMPPVASPTVANLQTRVKEQPKPAANTYVTSQPGVTTWVNPNANMRDRGELRRRDNGCGDGQGCGVSYGNDTGTRGGVGYGSDTGGTGNGTGQGSSSSYGNNSVDPDPPPPPPGRKLSKPKTSSIERGNKQCFSRPRDPSSNLSLLGPDRILVCN